MGLGHEFPRTYPVGVEMEEAIELLLSAVGRTKVEMVTLDFCDGRILGEDIFARENIPPFDRSPYDGYAFRACDIGCASEEHPVTLRVTEELPAGTASSRILGEGEAVRIMTGAPIPEGADCVEKYESTSYTSDSVTISHPLRSGENICRAGEDIRLGERILEKGTRLSPSGIALLAGLGHREVPCFCRLRAAIISTGSELVPVEEELAPGKIRNTNSYVLRSLLRQWGMDGEIIEIVPDDREHIARAIGQCAQDYDLIVTTGGVSVGDYDLVEAALADMGAKILFWKLRMKPGMAALAAVYRDKPVLALSGNPSAAVAVFCLVGRTILRYMAGERDYRLKKCRVHTSGAFPKGSPARRFLPGILRVCEDGLWIDFSSRQGNGMLSQWDGYDVIGEIPGGSPPLERGTVIDAFY